VVRAFAPGRYVVVAGDEVDGVEEEGVADVPLRWVTVRLPGDTLLGRGTFRREMGRLRPDPLAPGPPPAPDTPQQPAAPAPPAAGGVLGTQARSCTSRRSFRIKLRNHGQKVVKATVIVNGKRVKVLRGKRLTSRVNLRGLQKARFSVRIKLELANGKTISGVRRYLTCTPGRKSGPPKV
jgi:hypothetical protein